MLTDSLVGREMLPNLDVGECVVVEDAIMLLAKIILDKPIEKPKSATKDFGIDVTMERRLYLILILQR